MQGAVALSCSLTGHQEIGNRVDAVCHPLQEKNAFIVFKRREVAHHKCAEPERRSFKMHCDFLYKTENHYALSPIHLRIHFRLLSLYILKSLLLTDTRDYKSAASFLCEIIWKSATWRTGTNPLNIEPVWSDIYMSSQTVLWTSTNLWVTRRLGRAVATASTSSHHVLLLRNMLQRSLRLPDVFCGFRRAAVNRWVIGQQNQFMEVAKLPTPIVNTFLQEQICHDLNYIFSVWIKEDHLLYDVVFF